MIENNQNTRLHVVDALRGFAIVAIMLLHNIEHFDVYFTPENLPSWMAVLDKVIWEVLFFLFAGKSYAIFALLFGLTFVIQSDNQAKMGNKFGGRFLWRMILLFGFGLLNSIFYQGDILIIYAMLGIFLIPVPKLSNRFIMVVIIILIFLPQEWVKLVVAVQNPDTPMQDPSSWTYYGNMWNYITESSFFNTAIGNLTNGKRAVFLWSWENGRFLLILALFLMGVLAGRKKLFVWSETTKKFWLKTLIISTIIVIPLLVIESRIDSWVRSEAIRRPLGTIISTWTDLSFMLVWVAGFSLLFHMARFNRILNYFSAFGKMSLSNYIIQSALGSFIYYGFGLGLYQYTGTTYSFIIAVILIVLLGFFCKWWTTHFKRGPFETLWHRTTWIKL